MSGAAPYVTSQGTLSLAYHVSISYSLDEGSPACSGHWQAVLWVCSVHFLFGLSRFPAAYVMFLFIVHDHFVVILKVYYVPIAVDEAGFQRFHIRASFPRMRPWETGIVVINYTSLEMQ